MKAHHWRAYARKHDLGRIRKWRPFVSRQASVQQDPSRGFCWVLVMSASKRKKASRWVNVSKRWQSAILFLEEDDARVMGQRFTGVAMQRKLG